MTTLGDLCLDMYHGSLLASASPCNRAAAMIRPLEEPGGPRGIAAADATVTVAPDMDFTFTGLGSPACLGCVCDEPPVSVESADSGEEYIEGEGDARLFAIEDAVDPLRARDAPCEDDVDPISIRSFTEFAFIFFGFLVGVSSRLGDGGRFPLLLESFFFFDFWDDDGSSGESMYGDAARWSSIFAFALRAPRRPVPIPIQFARC